MRCKWEETQDGNWETECGNLFIFELGTPTENRFKYCPYCGKQLTEIRYKGGTNEQSRTI